MTSRPRGADRPARIGVALAILFAAALFGLGVTAGDPLYTAAEAVALAAVFGMPAVLGVLSLKADRPLRLAAGVDALAMGLFPFFLWNLALVVPGIFLLVSYGRSPAGPRDYRNIAVPIMAVVANLLALFLPFLHHDPRCVRFPGGVSCTDDVTTAWEAAVVVVFIAMVAFSLHAVTRPRTPAAVQVDGAS